MNPIFVIWLIPIVGISAAATVTYFSLRPGARLTKRVLGKKSRYKQLTRLEKKLNKNKHKWGKEKINKFKAKMYKWASSLENKGFSEVSRIKDECEYAHRAVKHGVEGISKEEAARKAGKKEQETSNNTSSAKQSSKGNDARKFKSGNVKNSNSNKVEVKLTDDTRFASISTDMNSTRGYFKDLIIKLKDSDPDIKGLSKNPYSFSLSYEKDGKTSVHKVESVSKDVFLDLKSRLVSDFKNSNSNMKEKPIVEVSLEGPEIDEHFTVKNLNKLNFINKNIDEHMKNNNDSQNTSEKHNTV